MELMRCGQLIITLRQILFTLSVTLCEIGCNYCMEIPGSLEMSIGKYYGLNSSQFSLFYSLYYLPVIISNPLGGFLIDRCLGIKWTTIVYAIIGITGIMLFVAGSLLGTFWIMLLGRLIFGLGNEIATGVSVNYCMFSWYKNIMNFVATLNSNVSFLGTLAIYQTAPRLLSYLTNDREYNPREALGFVILTTSLVYIPTVILAIWMTTLGPNSAEATEEESRVEEDRVSFRVSDLSRFPPVFWTLTLYFGVNYALTTFSQYSQGLFTEHLHRTVKEASDAVAVMNTAQIVTSVPISILVDKIGRNCSFVVASAFLTLVPHTLLLFDLAPLPAMFILGTAQSLLGSSILPMFGYPLDKNLIGSGYGIVGSMNGLSLFVSPLIMGYLIDTYGFDSAQLFYVSAASVNIIIILLVWILDARSSGLLNMSQAQRALYWSRNESEDESRSEPARLHAVSSTDQLVVNT